MNIKSLLFGSAAALAVASAAQAADAVVAAEPEPMEYVKVCDAYGTGFFYMPGTETCLKVGGELRFEKRIYKAGNQDESYDNHSRVKLDVEAKNDSEWGTVYSWIRVQGDQTNNGTGSNLGKSAGTRGQTDYYDGSGSSTGLNWYYIFGIGGLEFGNYDSLWARFLGEGGFTDDGGVHTSDWDFPDSRQYVSYTAEFGAIKAFISLDNDADEYNAVTYNADGTVDYRGEDHSGGRSKPNRGHEYMPDVSAGATGTFANWQVGGNVAYDESDESVALKGIIAGNFGMFGVRLMPLWSSSNQNIYFDYDGFSAILGLQAKVAESVTLSKDIQWWDNGDWRVVGDVNWEVASGFSVLVEGIYFNPDKGADVKSGFLRFQRMF